MPPLNASPWSSAGSSTTLPGGTLSNTPFANLRDFGAKCDGSTNDTAAWNLAFSTLPAGSILRVPRGRSCVNSLYPPNGITIVGEGTGNATGSSIFGSEIYLISGTNSDLIASASASGIILEKLTLNGNMQGNTTGMALNLTTTGSNGAAVVLRDMLIFNAASYANASIFLGGQAWLHCENVRAQNCSGYLHISCMDSTFHGLYTALMGVAMATGGQASFSGSQMTLKTVPTAGAIAASGQSIVGTSLPIGLMTTGLASGTVNTINSVYNLNMTVGTIAQEAIIAGAATVPGVFVDGYENKFISCYWGGNGSFIAGAQHNVQVYGGASNQFIHCVNDSANGHGYFFSDDALYYAQSNQIIGGTISNASQAATNSYYGIYFTGHSSNNTVKGVTFLNNNSPSFETVGAQASFSGKVMTLTIVPTAGTTVIGAGVQDGYVSLPYGLNIVSLASGSLNAVNSTYNLNMNVGTVAQKAVTFSGAAMAYAVAENVATAGQNLVEGCQIGVMGTGPVALVGAGGSLMTNCQGANPVGMATPTVGSSPYTYTNLDNVAEAIYVTGGTVSQITKGGLTIFSASPATIYLMPNESITITYSASPTLHVDRK